MAQKLWCPLVAPLVPLHPSLSSENAQKAEVAFRGSQAKLPQILVEFAFHVDCHLHHAVLMLAVDLWQILSCICIAA